jgi:AcrR family transcriptional regulator
MQQPERRTQAARSQAARDQIVQAALTVFALKGYAASSMDDVCLAAGCSKGGLYHHFPTKATVLSGVVDRLAKTNALVPPLPGDASTPPGQTLGRVLLEIWAESARSDDLRRQLQEGYRASLDQRIRTEAPLAEILRIGALIQLLTRAETFDVDEAARRLGVRPAA